MRDSSNVLSNVVCLRLQLRELNEQVCRATTALIVLTYRPTKLSSLKNSGMSRCWWQCFSCDIIAWRSAHCASAPCQFADDSAAVVVGHAIDENCPPCGCRSMRGIASRNARNEIHYVTRYHAHSFLRARLARIMICLLCLCGEPSRCATCQIGIFRRPSYFEKTMSCARFFDSRLASSVVVALR